MRLRAGEVVQARHVRPGRRIVGDQCGCRRRLGIGAADVVERPDRAGYHALARRDVGAGGRIVGGKRGPRRRLHIPRGQVVQATDGRRDDALARRHVRCLGRAVRRKRRRWSCDGIADLGIHVVPDDLARHARRVRPRQRLGPHRAGHRGRTRQRLHHVPDADLDLLAVPHAGDHVPVDGRACHGRVPHDALVVAVAPCRLDHGLLVEPWNVDRRHLNQRRRAVAPPRPLEREVVPVEQKVVRHAPDFQRRER